MISTQEVEVLASTHSMYQALEGDLQTIVLEGCFVLRIVLSGCLLARMSGGAAEAVTPRHSCVKGDPRRVPYVFLAFNIRVLICRSAA